MKSVISVVISLIMSIICFAQDKKTVACPYVCCGSQINNTFLPDPADSLVRITERGIIIQFKKGSFSPYAINDLHLIIHDNLDYNRMINMDISSNDTTHGFVQTSFLITIAAETKDHVPVKMNSGGRIKFYIPTDSLADDFHKSLFSGFRNDMNVMEWQYESEQDTMINIDSCGYYIYHAKSATAYHFGKDVGLQLNEAKLKVKGFEHPIVYIIYKNINLIDFERPEKKGLYRIPNNTDPYNTIVVIKASKNGKNYFTELRLSEIKEGKNIKKYEVTEKYFIELNNTEIKLRIF